MFVVTTSTVGVLFDYPQKWYRTIAQYGLTTLGKAGFCLRHLVVEGRHLTASSDILKAIHIRQYDPIFQTSVVLIHENLQRLPWIQSVVVRRQLPDTLRIRIQERIPIAIWQNKGHFFYIDRDGVAIPLTLAPHLKHRYPICVGEQANQQVFELFELLKPYPMIRNKIHFLNWVRNRRWDITLKPNLVVVFPEDSLHASLHLLNVLLHQPDFSCNALARLDLRDPKQILVALHPPLKPHPIRAKGRAI
jgi:cell division protein FtsQ